MNSVNLFGRVGAIHSIADPNGEHLRLWLAVDEHDRIDLIPCTIHSSCAELISKYVCKGDRLIVSGRLRPSEDHVSEIEFRDSDEKLCGMTVEILQVTFVTDNDNTPPDGIISDEPEQDDAI